MSKKTSNPSPDKGSKRQGITFINQKKDYYMLREAVFIPNITYNEP